MTTPEHNPYQPPKSNVTPASSAPNGEFIPGGQTVSVDKAFTWIGGSWQLFKSAPGIWIVNVIIMIAISMLLGIIPLVGSIANWLVTTILIGGLMIGCKSIEEGQGMDVSHLFAGFKEKAGPLATVGLIGIAMVIGLLVVVGVLILIVFGAGLFQSITNEEALASFMMTKGLPIILLIILLCVALFIPIAMATWFAPALIVLQDLSAGEAIKQSFKGCLRNFLPCLVYAIVFVVLLIISMIPLFLGLFILIPMMYASIYVGYNDIFLKND